jgi:hypothetical protein
LGRFFEKSFSPLDVLKIDSFKEHGELRSCEDDAWIVGGGECETKGSFFESFIPDSKPIVVPGEDFDFLTGFIE